MLHRKDDITKSYYENTQYNFLSRGECAAIIISGEDYKKFTRKFNKPYDALFLSAMKQTLTSLCAEVPTCIQGYTSRFDIAVFFEAPEEFEMPSWYSFDTNKIATLSASIATLKFNRAFEKSAKSYVLSGNNFDETKKFTIMQAYVAAIEDGAFFTAKCFNIKKEKIADYIRLMKEQTSESALRDTALAYFKEEEIAGKSAHHLKKMIYEKAGVDFDKYPEEFRCGIELS